MPIVFQDDKLLFTEDGKLAMSANCCCCLDEPKDVTVKVRYILESFSLPAGTTVSGASALAVDPVNSITCTDGINGSPHYLDDTGSADEVTWPDENCAPPGEFSSIELTKVVSGNPEVESGSIRMDITFSAHVHRKGSVTVNVWPAIAWGCKKTCPTPGDTSCQDSQKNCKDSDEKWLRYASGFEYSTDNWQTSGSVTTGWDSATKTYTASPQPFTITLPIN